MNDPVEKEFRRKNQWYSFTGHLYAAVGGAAFIGLLGMIASSLVKVAAGGVAGAEAALIFSSPAPMLAMGGLMVLGTACVWMAQREFTELKCIGDEHLAIQNARKLQSEVQITKAVEHSQNSRADGKSWVSVVNPGQQAANQQHAR